MNIIRCFRDAAADTIGLRLPGHDEYTCHITLAYTLTVAEGEEAEKLAELVRKMEGYIADIKAAGYDLDYMDRESFTTYLTESAAIIGGRRAFFNRITDANFSTGFFFTLLAPAFSFVSQLQNNAAFFIWKASLLQAAGRRLHDKL